MVVHCSCVYYNNNIVKHFFFNIEKVFCNKIKRIKINFVLGYVTVHM